jgi:signal transduction histidine kinase
VIVPTERRLSGYGRPGAASLVMLALLASLAVTVALAKQAIGSSRERAAISAAMLRQYAQLAAWEFAREVRRETEQRLMHTLNTYAHPESGSKGAGKPCNCLEVAAVEHWLEAGARGDAGAQPETVTRALAAVAAASPAGELRADGGVRVLPMPRDRQRFIAVKDEPHLKSGPGDIGLVMHVRALATVLSHVYGTNPLLPPELLRGTAGAVSVRVVDAAGSLVFATPGADPGPLVVTAPLWTDEAIVLNATVSMTPAFIASLGPEHRAGLSSTLIGSLLAVNAVLVAVGVWQLRRERELARLRGNFIAGVSHELRTPLAQIRMFSETLLLDRVRNDTERTRAIEIIGQESTRLTQLIDNVLLFHRGPQPAEPEHRQSVELNDLTRSVVESFEPLAAAKHAQIAVSCPAEPVSISGDQGELRQVLLNLLDNAVKFGPAGQTITVTVRSGASAALTVDDCGPGVPPADRTRVFGAFVRGSETRGTGGAGIGLSIVQRIVTAHGGDVSISAAPGGGARVRVTLPITSSRDRD